MSDFPTIDHAPGFLDGLITVEQLARILHKSPSSIRSDASRSLDSLPPVCRLPGNKRLLWRCEDVHAWIAKFVESAPVVMPVASSAHGEPRRRGRPRKTEQRVQT